MAFVIKDKTTGFYYARKGVGGTEDGNFSPDLNKAKVFGKDTIAKSICSDIYKGIKWRHQHRFVFKVRDLVIVPIRIIEDGEETAVPEHTVV